MARRGWMRHSMEELQDEIKLVRGWLSRDDFAGTEEIGAGAQLAYLFVRMEQEGELAEGQPATLTAGRCSRALSGHFGLPAHAGGAGRNVP